MSRRRRRRPAPAGHLPLRIEAHLCAPLAGPQPWVHLDAVLEFAAGHATGAPSFRRERAPTSADTDLVEIPLPLAREGSVWCCSALWPAHEVGRGATYWHMRPALEHAHLLRPRQVAISGGPTKGHRRRLPLTPTRHLVGHCIGDPGQIGWLLGHIGSVGKKRSQGYGVVDRWEVEEDPAATAAWRVLDGRARRPLPDPAGLLQGVRPPYWYRPWWELALSPGDPLPAPA